MNRLRELRKERWLMNKVDVYMGSFVRNMNKPQDMYMMNFVVHMAKPSERYVNYN